MKFGILGSLEVREDGAVLPLSGTKQRALLAILLLHANEVVSTDRLVDELWGDSPPDSAVKTLQVHISQLRKSLPGGPDVLLTRAPGYLLHVEEGELDAERFERLVSEARAQQPARACVTLREALALWRGPALADFAYESFAQTEAARLEELRMTALEERLAADLELGHHAELVGELESLVARHSLRERLRGLLILALYRSGRQAEALEAYRDARRVLVDQLGIEPSRALKELERRILAQDAALEPERPVEPGPRPEGLVGRERELNRLLPLVERALSGEGGMVLIAGEPGIGKSRLAEALVARAGELGGRALVGRCWEAGGAPAFWPWIQAVRPCLRDKDPDTVRSWVGRGGSELAAMLPELRDVLPDLPAADASSPSGARFRLFESFASFLRNAASAEPLALVLDDLHAADAPSVLLLRFVAEELAGAPVLIIGCYRDTEVGAELAEALPELTRSAAVERVSLIGLGRSDTTRLLELVTGRAPTEELAARVHKQTDGNPLFAGEVGRLLASEDAESPDRLPVPEGVRETIGRRLRGMSDPCRRVLTLASVLGREFDLDALERVSALPQGELDSALEEAIAARVVGEVPDGGARLRFSHMLIRDVVYEELPATRRLRLHGEIAEALESLYGANLEPHLAELAHHYLLRGAAGAEKAVRYAAAAGDRAASQLAFEEAARHYRSSLEVLESTGAGHEEQACDLLLALGDVLHRAGRGAQAKGALRRAADIAENSGWAERLARAALGYSGRFAWARASTDPAFVPLLERAIAAVGDADSQARVRLLARLAAATRDDPIRDRRAGFAEEGVEIAERMGDPRTLAYALEGYWVAVEGPDTAIELLDVGKRLIPLAEQIGEKEMVFAVRDHRLNTLWSLGDRAAVDVEIAALSALADDLRQPAQRWSLGTDRTMLALMEGRFEDAERLIAETLALGEQAESWNAHVTERLALFVLRREQGRLAELEETIARSVHEYPALIRFRGALAHLYGELGRERDARGVLEQVLSHDLKREYLDAEWLFTVGLLADPCAFVGDERAMAELYSLLLPHENRYAQAPVEASFGSIARGLGVLGTALGRLDEAERHFEVALDVESRMRARPWLAHAQHDMAKTLLARGERGRANDLLGHARALYGELGMTSWLERAEALAEELAGRA
jgi:DNA-binding SARP family transcriptional activator/tetratricopeptide (TPR) repeat protein